MMLSYIIPVFNGENTVSRCLDSIINVNMPGNEYEVIVVDDCSTDNTPAILENYKPALHHMTVYRQEENHRQGAARNKGLELAKGEYVTFVDADDVVECGVVNALDFVNKQQVDILCAGALFSNSKSGDIEHRHVFSPDGEVHNGREFCERFFDFKYNDGTTVWGCLFRRSFLLTMKRPFVEDRQWEDCDWVAHHFYKAQSIACISSEMYRYINTPASTMNTVSFSSVADHIACCCRRMQISQSLSDDGSSFADKVYNSGVRAYYIDRQVDIKLFSVFKLKDVMSLYRNLGHDNISYLAKYYDGPRKIGFVFKHKILAQCAFITLIPIMKIYRLVKFGSTTGFKNQH